MGTLKIRGIGPIAIMSRIIYNIRDMKGGGIVDNGYTKRIRERVLSLEDGTVFMKSQNTVNFWMNMWRSIRKQWQPHWHEVITGRLPHVGIQH